MYGDLKDSGSENRLTFSYSSVCGARIGGAFQIGGSHYKRQALTDKPR
jgi:hypothetical protein